MKLYELVANYVFNNLTNFKEGATIDSVKKELAGLDNELKGLSDDERTKLFEETPPLKSYLDGRVSRALDKKEKDLSTNYENERQKLTTQIEELRSKLPEPDVESLKQAYLNASAEEKEQKRREFEFAQMKSDMERFRKEKEESDKQIKKSKLLDVARQEIGDRKLPPFVKLDHYIGDDEDQTKERIKEVATQYDEFMKGINASRSGTETPPDGGENSFDLASKMNEAGDF